MRLSNPDATDFIRRLLHGAVSFAKAHRKAIIGCGTVLLLAALFLLSGFWSQPFKNIPCSTVLLDKQGGLLGAAVAADGQWRFPDMDSIPRKFTDALLCFEDKRFFSHIGIDPVACARAVSGNIKNRTVKSGGSTITMQVIRLSRKNQRRTIPEKLIEAALALRLEFTCSKEEILTLYASYAPFGGNVVGLEGASWRYFGCDPHKLSWAESAMLAVLPNSPSLVHPGKNRTRLLVKRNLLLDRLHSLGKLDSSMWVLSRLEPLPHKPFPLPRHAPHLLDRAAADADVSVNKLRSKKRSMSTTRIKTTIDGYLQRQVNESVMRHHRYLVGNGVHHLAALVIENRSGSIIAYAGNVPDDLDGRQGDAVDIIIAPRSTGSILKPFLYAAMMQSGEIVPEQLVADLPMRIGGFAPQNYSRSFEGAVPAYRALARSLNVPAVTLLHDYTVDRFYALLKKLGLTTLHRNAADYGLSLILGGAEGTLWDIAGMYARMAAQLTIGVTGDSTMIPPLHYREHRSAHVGTNREYPFDQGAIWLTFCAMEEVMRPEEMSGWEQFTSAKRIAWKTGTSYGFRDAWAVGVTPSYTVGIWAGNADGEGRPELTGIGSAAPLLFTVFDHLDAESWFECPEFDLSPLDICAKSGFRAGPDCASVKQVRVAPAGVHSSMCTFCRVVHCDTSLTFRLHSDCAPVASMKAEKWFVLPPAMEWFYRRVHAEYRPLPPWRENCADNASEAASASPVSIVYPHKKSTIYVPVELDGKRGRVVFEAAHRDAQVLLYWHLDDQYLGTTRNIHQTACIPEPGKHLLTVVDGKGNFAERRFTVMK